MSESSKTLHLSYSYGAPASLVYSYWTEPELISTWWGTHSSVVVDCSVELKVGGRWSIAMQTPSGRVFQNGGTYLQIEAPRLLRFSDVPVADLPEWGGVQRHPSVHTVDFCAVGNGTRVDLRVEYETAAELQLMQRLGMPDGIVQGLQRLSVCLKQATAR